jgi:hypothetical protein
VRDADKTRTATIAAHFFEGDGRQTEKLRCVFGPNLPVEVEVLSCLLSGSRTRFGCLFFLSLSCSTLLRDLADLRVLLHVTSLMTA